MFRAVLAAALAVPVLAAPAAAQPKRLSLKVAAADLAAQVQAHAKGAAVRVEVFDAPAGLRGNAGPAIAAELAAALKSAAPTAANRLSGSYTYVPATDDPDLKIIRVTAELRLVVGDRVVSRTPLKPVEIRYLPDIARLIGVTGTLSPRGSYSAANRSLQLSAVTPTAAVSEAKNSVVHPVKGSDFGVEIRTVPLQKAGRSRGADVFYNTTAQPVGLVGGEPFVPLDKGDVFEVHVFNYGPAEAAFTLAIDGIDQFTFTDDRNPDGRPKYTHFILPPGSREKPGVTVIYGWHKTVRRAPGVPNYLSFLVTDYGQGARSQFPNTPLGKVGMIELAFSPSLPETTEIRGRPAGAEVGFGPGGQQLQTVVKRVIDPAVAFLTIRYQR